MHILEFDTLTLTTLANTAVCGRVFASEPMLGDNGELVNEAGRGVAYATRPPVVAIGLIPYICQHDCFSHWATPREIAP